MILIDGSFGEGGGQILRTSLALSLVQRKPFKIKNIRANRKKPGLMRQHLTGVNAAAEIGQAEVKGNEIGSCELYFAPKTIKPGNYHFSVGTAGSCTLVLQTVLPALLIADAPSELRLEGGTHNPFAPPFDFLSKAFVPVLNRVGPEISVSLKRPGFYPAGGGEITAKILPCKKLANIELLQRGKIKEHKLRAVVAQLSEKIAEREIDFIKKRLEWNPSCMAVEKIENSKGPGNAIIAEIKSEYITEVFTGFGQRGVKAEDVANRVLKEIQEYLNADVPVGKHLTDQLLIPIALSGGGKIRTLSPTKHTTTNIDVIKQFLDIEISAVQIKDNEWEIGL